MARKPPIWPKMPPSPFPAMLEQGERVKAAFEIPPHFNTRFASGDPDWGHQLAGRRFSIGFDSASPDGDNSALIEVDYSGIELRIMAWYTGDEAMERYNQWTAPDAPNSTTGGQEF